MKRYHRLEDAFFAHAVRTYRKTAEFSSRNPEFSRQHQQACLDDLLSKAKDTQFGTEHDFDLLAGKDFHEQYRSFQELVPVHTYEDLAHYIELIKQGEQDILRPGEPKYLATTSGTTSGKKYIPLTAEATRDQMQTGKEAIVACLSNMESRPRLGVNYFLSGSPTLSSEGSAVPHGRLSGIVHKETPAIIRHLAQSPSHATNMIEQFDEKVQQTVQEHLEIAEDITLISGIPSYFEQYATELLKQSGKANLKEVFPNLQLLVYGGVDPAPYKQRLIELLGDDQISAIETYPASEGFIAYQDANYPLAEQHNGLLLKTDGDIFYEFIEFNEHYHRQQPRIWLGEVEVGTPYSLILNTNAGLWGYEIGDVIEFTSLDPYRIKVVGRTKHGISTWGEHVIGSEISELQKIGTQAGLPIVEYTVAPYKSEQENYHQWFVEADETINPTSLSEIAHTMDTALQSMNEYYADLRQSETLQCLQLNLIKLGSAKQYLMNKPGGFDPQMKLPRVQEKREIADFFLANDCLRSV